jgi:Arc/MetJ family transcription regulator
VPECETWFFAPFTLRYGEQGDEWILECIDFDSRIDHNGSMKTTIDIPDDELKAAMRFTKAKTKRDAVVRALAEFNRRRRMAELVRYSGTFSDRFPTNDEIEEVDSEHDPDRHARSRR